MKENVHIFFISKINWFQLHPDLSIASISYQLKFGGPKGTAFLGVSLNEEAEEKELSVLLGSDYKDFKSIWIKQFFWPILYSITILESLNLFKT